MGRKRGRNDAGDTTASCSALWAADVLDVADSEAQPVRPEVWCYGVAALSSTCCGRLATSSKGFYLAVRDALAERITLGLADGCVQADLASNRLQNPILALSHLESLAHSQFLFGGIRALLRYMVEAHHPQASICLLESSPSTDALGIGMGTFGSLGISLCTTQALA
eukprot:symbB.v1.2.005491.t1/scaffold321.1/size229442/4